MNQKQKIRVQKMIDGISSMSDRSLLEFIAMALYGIAGEVSKDDRMIDALADIAAGRAKK